MYYLKNIFLQGVGYLTVFMCVGLINNAQASEAFEEVDEQYPVQMAAPMQPVKVKGLVGCASPYENVFGRISYNCYENVVKDIPFDLEHSIGVITGDVSDVKVVREQDTYRVSLLIDDKLFSSNYFRLQNHDVLPLKATDGSELPLKLGSDVRAIQTAPGFEAALKELLGLTLNHNPAVFISASAPIGPHNNDVRAINVLAHPLSGYASFATYYLWSAAGRNEIVLSCSHTFWKTPVERDGSQSLRFNNNVYFDLGENYLRAKDIKPIEFWVFENTDRSVCCLCNEF